MRPALLLAVTALAALGAGSIDTPARADEARVLSLKQAVTLTAIPEVPLAPSDTAIPTAPPHIPPGEKVAGLWVTGVHAATPAEAAPTIVKVSKKKKGRKAKPAPASPGRVTAAIVTTGPTRPSLIAIPNGLRLQFEEPDSTPFPAETCLRLPLDPERRTSTSGPWSRVVAPAYVLEDSTKASISIDNGLVMPDRAPAPVRLVRSERLTSSPGGRVSLEVIEAWIDLRTQGAREVRRATIPLAPLLHAPGGVDVFAFRNEGKVTLVVRPPPPEADGSISRELTWRTDDDNGSSLCGHTLMPMSAAATGDAATAFVLGEVVAPVAPRAEGEAATKEVLSFRLALSEAWLGSDPEPRVSASFGWHGKPRPVPNAP